MPEGSPPLPHDSIVAPTNFRSPQRTVLAWFVAAARRYPLPSAALIVLSVVNTLADGLSITLLIPFLTVLFARDAEPEGLLGRALRLVSDYAGAGNELIAISGLILVLVALRCACAYVAGSIAVWISASLSCEIRARIHENLLKVDYGFLITNKQGRFMNALDDEAWSATDAVTSFFDLFTSLCMILVFSTILLVVSWKLSCFVFLFGVAASAFLLILDQRSKVIGAESLVAAETLSDHAVELLGAMRVIRAFGREPEAQTSYVRASRRLFELAVRRERVRLLNGGLQEVVYAASVVVIVFVALGLEVPTAALVAYLALLHRLQPHVVAVNKARNFLASISASVETVANLLDLHGAHPTEPGGLRVDRFEGAIQFQNVSFAYSGQDAEQRPALDAATLEIPFGKTTAIVGSSGAGKSTLINLLFRFYVPERGSITVAGRSLADLDVAWWRSQLSLAGQDAELLSGTIFENISYGKEGATLEEVTGAAQRASVHDFIMSLPKGYETRVGSRGMLLSGGQRQRIGLARALVRKSAILVLDEATNSVDSMTESEILEFINELKGEATVIIVAHRVRTTRSADHVVSLAEGRVIEAGPPDVLATGDGPYRRMLELQQLHPEPATGESLDPAHARGGQSL